MSEHDDLTDFVIQAIEEECDKQFVSIKMNSNWKYDNNAQHSKSYKLWEYLYSHVFVNEKQEYVFPVIAIDQIEEAFKEKYEQACELLSQLYYLVSDDLRLPNNCYACMVRRVSTGPFTISRAHLSELNSIRIFMRCRGISE